LVTFIQMIGNIFYSYNEIDANGELFKSWVELTGPVWELMGTEQTDLVGLKRWLAFLEGGLLPIISLTSLHFFVKYEDPNSPKEEETSPKEEPLEVDNSLQEEVDRVWSKVKELKEEGKLPETTEDDIIEEPTALANSKYRNEEYDPNHHLIEEDDPTQDMVEGASVEKNKTAGEELNRTWLNIIKNRKNNNQIDRV